MYTWLFTYIYKDIYENVYHNKLIAKILVLLISAAVHEVMLACTIRMFYPFLFIVFFTSGAMGEWFKFKNQSVSHIMSKFLFLWGSGFLLTAYSIEYSAQRILPPMNNSLADYLIPRSIFLFI